MSFGKWAASSKHAPAFGLETLAAEADDAAALQPLAGAALTPAPAEAPDLHALLTRLLGTSDEASRPDVFNFNALVGAELSPAAVVADEPVGWVAAENAPADLQPLLADFAALLDPDADAALAAIKILADHGDF